MKRLQRTQKLSSLLEHMHLLSLPRAVKRLLALTADALLCVFTVWLALCLRLDEVVAMQTNHWIAVGLSLVFALPVFVLSGLYRGIFRHANSVALLAVTKAMVIYGTIYAALLTTVALPGVPRSVGFIQPLLLLLGVGASRVLARYILSGTYLRAVRRDATSKVLIYGAGEAGRQLVDAMRSSRQMHAVGFLDDDPRLHGQEINGLHIYSPQNLEQLIEQLMVSDVLLAIPSASRQRRNDILQRMREVRVSVRSIPGLMELAQGNVRVNDLIELDIEDLLGRDTVPPDALLLQKNITGKVVLVTGAGGSIGSELCRQIIRSRPLTLLLIELNEYALYSIHQELQQVQLVQLAIPNAEVILVPLLASVRDEGRMHEIMRTWKPHTVYHAAAYKHVPLVEHNPAEGIKNNVMGTLSAALAAAAHGVADFVLVSTDKAVRPTSVMGASKRLAEMLLQALAASLGSRGWQTKFTMVRFGNVLGSSGSVVPLFRDQIKKGGPVTLTHKDMTRYLMSIPEAAQLVIQAGAMAQGGDVFVLDMGKPVRIIDLATRMIELSGLAVRNDVQPNGDIEINVTGLRPGEKLYEELLIGDNPLTTQHPKIFKANEDFLPWAELQAYLAKLTLALDANDVATVRLLLQQIVPGYQPDGGVVDWVHLEELRGGQMLPQSVSPVVVSAVPSAGIAVNKLAVHTQVS